jgi:hypothetical protein
MSARELADRKRKLVRRWLVAAGGMGGGGLESGGDVTLWVAGDAARGGV